MPAAARIEYQLTVQEVRQFDRRLSANCDAQRIGVDGALRSAFDGLKPYRLDLTPAFGRHNRVARDQLDSAERWVINVMADFNHGDHGNTAGARRAGNGGRQIARSENDHPSATIQVPVRLEQIQRTHAAQHTGESPARESEVQVRCSCREDQLVSVKLPGAGRVEDAKGALAKAAPDRVPCQHLNTDV